MNPATLSAPAPHCDAPTQQGDLEELELATIVRDARTQIRVQMDDATVDRYADALRAGERLPPPIVFRDDAGVVRAADGHHRIAANEKLGVTHLICEVRAGSAREAWMCGLDSNRRNGLALRNADKVNVVLTLLREEESWRALSNREFAGALRGAVSYELVRQTRQRFVASDNGCQPPRTRPRQSSAADASPETGADINWNLDGAVDIAIAARVDRIVLEECGLNIADLNEDRVVHRTASAVVGASSPTYTLSGGSSSRRCDPSDTRRAGKPEDAIVTSDLDAAERRLVDQLRENPEAQVVYEVGDGLITVAERRVHAIAVYRARVVGEVLLPFDA